MDDRSGWQPGLSPRMPLGPPQGTRWGRTASRRRASRTSSASWPPSPGAASCWRWRAATTCWGPGWGKGGGAEGAHRQPLASRWTTALPWVASSGPGHSACPGGGCCRGPERGPCQPSATLVRGCLLGRRWGPRPAPAASTLMYSAEACLRALLGQPVDAVGGAHPAGRRCVRARTRACRAKSRNPPLPLPLPFQFGIILL